MPIAAQPRHSVRSTRRPCSYLAGSAYQLPRRKLSAPDVKAIREQFGMSQSDMATFLNASKRTLENWEQGRRDPTGPVQTLLRIMECEPNAVRRALRDDRGTARA